MASFPVVLSPALPSELLAYIITKHTFPTTLIICSSREEFLASLIQDTQVDDTLVTERDEPEPETRPSPQRLLLAAPLYQVAIARHIRMVFLPTVSHLRAFLSVFTLEDSKLPPPPDRPSTPSGRQPKQALLLVYGFLDLHRDTSEWSAQGLSATAAALVEATKRTNLRAVVVDRRSDDPGGDTRSTTDAGDLGSLLADEIPMLSSTLRRVAADTEDGAWSSRTVEVRRVLERWFRFERGAWQINEAGR